jgi:hypothetical protein
VPTHITTQPNAQRDDVVASAEEQHSSAPFAQMSFSPREAPSIRDHFQSLGDAALAEREFFPETKVHTSYGADIATLAQSEIPCASKDYRLRSNHLAQTLQLFGHKVSEILPESYFVQIDLSASDRTVCGDSVFLIRSEPHGRATSILERAYLPFDGGSIGWMLPTDEAKNTMLLIEERLFYYKTFMAIKRALELELPPERKSVLHQKHCETKS